MQLQIHKNEKHLLAKKTDDKDEIVIKVCRKSIKKGNPIVFLENISDQWKSSLYNP